MATYDLYGSTSDDLLEARDLLEESLRIKFDARDSDFQGGEYFQWGKTSGEHIVLKRNLDPLDGGPAEMSFSAHKVLLYLNETSRGQELQEKILETLKDFVVLRHEILN